MSIMINVGARRAIRRLGLVFAMLLALVPGAAAAERGPEDLPPASGASPLDATPATTLDGNLRCLLGVYAFPDGSVVTVTGSDGHPRDLQYTLSDGRFGSMQALPSGGYSTPSFTASFSRCDEGALTLTRGSVSERGARQRLVERHTSFESDGVRLRGKLVLPEGGRAHALAVWVEGSNNDPSTDDSVWQYELARRGVAMFVYDKRGTGGSSGAQTSDFFLRARDAAAAVAEARRLEPGIRAVGVIGGSQGGWVAPLAAKLVPLDFVVAAFALADGPIAQDQALVERQLREAGFDDEALAQARELTAITERIVRSNLDDGLEALDAFKREHADVPWMAAIQPRSYTGVFLRFSTAELTAMGMAAAQGLSFTYDPRPVIESIAPRQLWLLGGSDRQAPNAATQRILREIQQAGTDLSVVVFPNADHGLVEPVSTPDGVVIAYSPNVFDVAATWIGANRLPLPGGFIVMPTPGSVPVGSVPAGD